MNLPTRTPALLRLIVGCALAVGIPAGGALAQGDPSGDPAFLPPGARLEKIVDGEKHDLVFAEGPVVPATASSSGATSPSPP